MRPLIHISCCGSTHWRAG